MTSDHTWREVTCPKGSPHSTDPGEEGRLAGTLNFPAAGQRGGGVSVLFPFSGPADFGRARQLRDWEAQTLTSPR